MVSREVFAQRVKEALESLYSPTSLQTSPLVEWLSIQGAPGVTTAEQLRERLRQAIEALRPPASVPPGSLEAMGYRLLCLRYVQPRSRYAVCEELGYSQASYYRHHQEALEAVVSMLWEQVEQVASGRALVTSLDAAGAEEAARLALTAQREPVSLNKLMESIRETIQPLTEEQGLPLHVRASGPLPTAYGDLSVFRQIVLNLLTEGFKRTTEGLCLCVECEHDETVWRIQGLTAGDWAKTDLEAANGLIISRRLLRVYGGDVWIERDDRGAPSLVFVVPAARPRCVLIIDDDDDTISLYGRYLQAEGYAVLAARTHEQLQALLSEAAPDIILLDVLMPRWDGWMILQQLRMIPETADIPVIIASVLSQPALALAQGAAEVLKKPISEQSLLEAIRTVLAQQGSRG